LQGCIKNSIVLFLSKYITVKFVLRIDIYIQMGIEILTNSAKDIELEKKRMEYVLEKQKRLQVNLPQNIE